MGAQLMSAGSGNATSTSSTGTGFVVAGAVAQGAGTLMANAAQASAELQNASFHRQQADFAKQAMIREMQIADKDYAFKFGAQVSGYGKGGVDVGSGSASLVLAQTGVDRLNTLSAIRMKGQQDYDMAMARAVASENAASQLGSMQTQLITVAKSAAVIAASVYGGPAAGFLTAQALDGVGKVQPTGSGQAQEQSVAQNSYKPSSGFMTGPGWSSHRDTSGSHDFYGDT